MLMRVHSEVIQIFKNMVKQNHHYYDKQDDGQGQANTCVLLPCTTTVMISVQRRVNMTFSALYNL